MNGIKRLNCHFPDVYILVLSVVLWPGGRLDWELRLCAQLLMILVSDINTGFNISISESQKFHTSHGQSAD